MINKFGFYRQGKDNSQIAPPPPPSDNPSQKIEEKPLKQEQFATKLSKKQTYLRPEQFHPFQIPPSLLLAQLHCRATQFGTVSTAKILQSDQSDIVCNCCGQQQKEIIPICNNTNRIYRISQAQGYYFTYIKIIIVTLASIFLLAGLYTFITTIDYCSNSANCLFVYAVPLPQSVSYFNTIHMILSIIAAYLIYPFALYLFYYKAFIHEQLKQSIIKISDYSMLISGIDYAKITDKELVEALQEYAVQSILFTHQIGNYLPSMQKRYILQAKKNLYFKRGLTEKLHEVEKEIYEIGNIILPFKNNMNIGNERNLRTDKIIVKFRTVEDRENFSKKFHVNLFTRGYHVFLGTSVFTINDVPLYVQTPGEPEEMIWENLQVSSKRKLLMVFVNTFVNAIILGMSLALILWLTHQQNQKQQSNQIFISFLMAFIIEIINMVLYLAIFRLTQAEKRITLTGKIIARITRNVIVFFFNTTLIPFSLFLLDWLNSDRYLVYEYILSLFVVNNLISPLSPIFNPFYLYKLYCKRKIQREGRDCLFTQLQTNQIYEKSDFQLELKYELLSQRIMNCCFYAAVLPQVIIVTIIGLGIDYWIEKWWLLNHCCIPKFSARLGDIINRITIFFPAIYLFGYLANLKMMQDSSSLPKDHYAIILTFAFLSVLISIFVFISAKKFMQSYVKQHQSLLEKDVSVCVKELDYCDLNPTSFLHIDLQNTLGIKSSGNKTNRQQNFQKIQEFVLRRKKEALTRRDTQGLKRYSFMKEVKQNNGGQSLKQA